MHRVPRGLLAVTLVILGLLAWQQYRPGSGIDPVARPVTGGAVETAYAERQSGVWLEAGGRVSRILADDAQGSRHQRFILRLDSGHTLLVVHNIDLARRVPLGLNDQVGLRGRYEWNARGGLVHWTHHDPEGRIEGGWIAHAGQRYR